jgi:GGDEF domain-containing protein
VEQIVTLPTPGPEPDTNAPLEVGAPDGAAEHALRDPGTGRRLVMYERTTGLLAHWYLALRCDEECQRARRYGQTLSLAVIEPQPGVEARQFSDRMPAALRERLRKADLAGYLGNARFVVLMPETGQPNADKLLGRLLRGAPGAQAGVSTFPRDGRTFSSLYAVAARRLARGSALQARRYHRIDQAA